MLKRPLSVGNYSSSDWIITEYVTFLVAKYLRLLGVERRWVVPRSLVRATFES